MKPVNVIEATHDDIVHFLRMGRDFSMLADEPFDRESLTQHLEWLLDEERAVVYLAVDIEGKPVGICAGLWFPTFWDNSKVTATELWWYVDPEARNAGIGGALMDALESWAEDAGAWRLSMMTIAGIAPGVEQMYTKRGYREREKTFVKEL
jgi:GNAT superfamily N-acetyltransferase